VSVPAAIRTTKTDGSLGVMGLFFKQ
jgi:hypothetical protein